MFTVPTASLKATIFPTHIYMEESNLTGQNKMNYVTNVCMSVSVLTIFQKDSFVTSLKIRKFHGGEWQDWCSQLKNPLFLQRNAKISHAAFQD